MNKTIAIIASLMIAFMVLTIVLFNQVFKYKREVKDQVELYDALTDSLEVYKTKDGLNAAKIQVIQTEREKDFLKIKNLEGTNLELQNLVKNKDKEIDELNVALILASETVYIDTIRLYYPIGGDTLIFSKSVLLDRINNDWIDATFGFNRGFSYIDLRIKNQYNVLIGYEGKTLFKPGIPYARVINLNPYTTTVDMRAYQVSLPKPDKFGISLQTGFGGLLDLYNKNFGYGIYAGIGFNYTIFSW